VRRVRTADEEHPDVFDWLANAHARGGGFISHCAGACLQADAENYQFLRVVVPIMVRKYPQYLSPEAVARDIAREVADDESLAAGERSIIGHFAQSVRTWFRKLVE